MPGRDQLARMPEPPLPKGKGKEKEPSLFRSSDREKGESQGEREQHLDKREGGWAGLHNKKGEFQKGEGVQVKELP